VGASSSSSSSDDFVRAQLVEAVTRALHKQAEEEHAALVAEAEEAAELGEALAERRRVIDAATRALEEREHALTEWLVTTAEQVAAAKEWLDKYEAGALGTDGGGAAAAASAAAEAAIAAVAAASTPAEAAAAAAAARSAARALSALPALLGGSDGAAVEPATPLQRQLLRLVAEDVALEDYLGHVEGALRARRIRPDEMVAEVRDVARRQFQARALARKIDAALAASRAAEEAAAGRG